MRILLVQPSLSSPGGGNLVAAWIVQALRDHHDVTLLSWQPPDLAVCNRSFGTSLRAADLRVQLAPAWARWLARFGPTPLVFLRDSLLFRQCVTRAGDFDLVVTANNEADLGRPGIQYIHYPRLDLVRPAVDLRWYHGSRRLLALYRRLCARVARFSAARMKANVTLVNSQWTGRRVRAVHGIEPVVLYPPVAGVFPDVPWSAREDGFVYIGRISPEKRIETVIEILERIRAAGRDLRLHVVGSPDDRRYGRHIRRLIGQRARWVTLHENLGRDDLTRLISRQRYGIHAMVDEHFGIAVAEMMYGGCVVFVHRDGGPREIVGEHARLLFDSVEDAVEKILAVLDDPAARDALRAHLAGRAALFSAERFVRDVRAIVAQAEAGARRDTG
jgi:glycosyltransferase involved in cell wall biosynthesis